jgi:hypothetical protein
MDRQQGSSDYRSSWFRNLISFRNQFGYQALQTENANDLNDIAFSRGRKIQSIIDFACIIIVFFAFSLVYIYLDPRLRGFYCNDTDIFNPLRDDTIKFYIVGIFGTIGPVFLIALIELVNVSNITTISNTKIVRRSIFALYVTHALSLFILGIGINMLLTEIGKRWIGRLRPNFIEICKVC